MLLCSFVTSCKFTSLLQVLCSVAQLREAVEGGQSGGGASRPVLKKNFNTWVTPLTPPTTYDTFTINKILNLDVMKLLALLSLSGKNSEEKCEAASLKKYFERFSSVIIVVLLSQILGPLDIIS
jgi:hypothetical protein